MAKNWRIRHGVPLTRNHAYYKPLLPNSSRVWYEHFEHLNSCAAKARLYVQKAINHNHFKFPPELCVNRRVHAVFFLPTDSYENGGQWSEWSEWSHCTTTCGGGLTYSKRRCITHFPSGHGQNCTGKGIKVRLCHVNSCKTTDAKKVNLERTLSEMAEDRSHIYKPSVSGING